MVGMFGWFDSFFVVLGRVVLEIVYEVGSLFEWVFEIIRCGLVLDVDFGEVGFEGVFERDDVLDEEGIGVFEV